MHYFALLLCPTPPHARGGAGRTEMAAYQDFHAKAASAIRAGDALTPSATGVRITGGPDAPVVTDGPFAEGAEMAGGYYVFEAENLDEALALARDIPAAKYGAVEVWPMVKFSPARAPLTGDSWLALLLEPPGRPSSRAPRSGRRESRRTCEFGKLAGDRAVGGAPLHPPTTATTVRVRDGEVLLTDGPFAEGAEVANGFYYINAADRDEAVKLASMIPATTVELRRLAGVSGL